jgi:hypothetical protein
LDQEIGAVVGDHHMCACAGVIDQPGAAPLSAIDQPAAPSSVGCTCGDGWNAPDVLAKMTAVTVRAVKTNFFMGLSSVSLAVARRRVNTAVD